MLPHPRPSRRAICLPFVAALALASPASHAAPPSNDDFANAIDLGANPTATAAAGSTLDEATVELGEPFVRTLVFDEFTSENYGSTVWWKWTCPAGSQRLVNLSTAGSEEDGIDPQTFDPVRIPLDSLLMVFTGADLETLTPVAESDDRIEDATSAVSFIATPGTVYWIRVDARNQFPTGTSLALNLGSSSSLATAAERIAWGKALLTYDGEWNTATAGRLVPIFTTAALDGAAFQFQEALKLEKNNPEANLLLALISLLKLQKEPAFAALLAEVGLQDTSSDPEHPNYALPEAPDGSALFANGALSTAGLNYVKNVVRPRLAATLVTLEKITSQTFLIRLPDHLRVPNVNGYLDYGDLLMLRAGCKTLLGAMDFLESYDLVAPLQNLADLEKADQLNAQNVTEALVGLLELSTTDKRAALKTNFLAAITLYNQASAHVRSKRPLARDASHLFSFLEDTAAEAELRGDLAKITQLLGGASVTHDGWTFSLAKVLAGTMSLRDIMPNFKGNKVIRGSLPTTLATVLPGSPTDKIYNYLTDEEYLYDGLLSVALGVAPGLETLGSVTGTPGDYTFGTQLTVSAQPTPGFVFTGWAAPAGYTVSTLSPFVFPVVREYSLFAVFGADNRDNDKDGLSNYDEIIVKQTNPDDADTDDDGWPDSLDDQPTVANPRQFVVSQNFADIPLQLPSGVILSISGLPPGVTYNARTGALTGRPNALPGTQTNKAFALKATVKPVSGPNYTLNLVLNVQALPEQAVGTFSGLVELNAAPEVTDLLGGSVSLTTTSSGGVTGKISLGGKLATFPANLRLNTTSGSSLATISNVQLTLPKPLLPVSLSLELNMSTGRITGQLERGPAMSLFTAVRCPWKATNRATGVAGVYNAALSPDSALAGNNSYPQGSGYATVKITDLGAVTWTGKLADGSAFTFSTTLGGHDEFAIHLMLYGNTGSFQGWAFTGKGGVFDDGPLNWTKKPQPANSTSRSYKDGFPAVMDVRMRGNLYTTPAVLYSMIGLQDGSPANDNILMQFDQGGLTAAINQLASLYSPNRVVLPTSTTLNPAGVKFTFVPATGVFTGSFSTGTPARKADFSGIVVPFSRSPAVGYFLLPQAPVGTESPTKTPILSGSAQVRITP